MENIGRYLFVGGLILAVIGAGVFVAGKLGVPWVRLPGDIRIENEGGSFYIPITTSILLSLILTVALNLLLRILRK